jgi:hypothetical protein
VLNLTIDSDETRILGAENHVCELQLVMRDHQVGPGDTLTSSPRTSLARVDRRSLYLSKFLSMMDETQSISESGYVCCRLVQSNFLPACVQV